MDNSDDGIIGLLQLYKILNLRSDCIWSKNYL